MRGFTSPSQDEGGLLYHVGGGLNEAHLSGVGTRGWAGNSEW